MARASSISFLHERQSVREMSERERAEDETTRFRARNFLFFNLTCHGKEAPRTVCRFQRSQRSTPKSLRLVGASGTVLPSATQKSLGPGMAAWPTGSAIHSILDLDPCSLAFSYYHPLASSFLSCLIFAFIAFGVGVLAMSSDVSQHIAAIFLEA